MSKCNLDFFTIQSLLMSKHMTVVHVSPENTEKAEAFIKTIKEETKAAEKRAEERTRPMVEKIKAAIKKTLGS